MLLKIAFSFLKPTPLYDETRATPHSPRFRKAFYASVRRATLLTLPSHQRQAYPLADRTILRCYCIQPLWFCQGIFAAVGVLIGFRTMQTYVRIVNRAYAHNITISEAQKEAQEAQKPLPLPFLLLLYLLLKCKVFSLYTCKRTLLY